MNEFETKCFNLFDKMLNDRCDMFGVKHTIAWLKDEGFTAFEIAVKLGFDDDDVKDVFENPDADFADWLER